jgi:molybdopterin molybdotransferase
VSTLVCFKLFVEPALRKLAGERSNLAPRVRPAHLAVGLQQRDARETYFPARLEQDVVTLLAWQGSADLRSLAEANALVRFPSGEGCYVQGQRVEVLEL